jgi:hypothetical protein
VDSLTGKWRSVCAYDTVHPISSQPFSTLRCRAQDRSILQNNAESYGVVSVGKRGDDIDDPLLTGAFEKNIKLKNQKQST